MELQRDEETKRRRDEVKEKENIPTSSTSSLALLSCAALLTAFALTAWFAWLPKCATYDEPMHLVAAWTQTHQLDFRCDSDNPPLWKFYIAAATRRRDLILDQQTDAWTKLLTSISAQRSYATHALFQTPGNDTDALIRAARARMIVLAALLGALIAWWAWRLRGPVAAVVAAAAFALDPNFLAHGPLVKNDVPIALLFVAFMASVWLTGQRATLPRCALLALLLGAALTTKFSAVLAIPILAVALLARVLIPAPWPVLRWTAARLSSRFAAAAAIAVAALIISYGFIWLCYGFRFNSAPGPAGSSSLDDIILVYARTQSLADHHASLDTPASQREQWVAQWHPGPIVKSTQWADRHHVLPQAFLRGFLTTYAGSLARGAFLCGMLSLTGWWYYFPLAMAFKTPLATLIASLLALALGFRSIKSFNRHSAWALCAVLIAPALYMIVAMRSHLDLGIRHVLPVYPFLFIFLGVVAADAWKRFGQPAAWIISILILGLALETYGAYPNYIPFFNVAAGGYRGGVRLLGDSNIDWGQDLPDLADWQVHHPDRQLWLCYFGTVDPLYYGIHYINLPGSDAPPDQFGPNGLPPVFAISATAFGGQHLRPEQRAVYDRFRSAQPLAILGGSIWLYDGS